MKKLIATLALIAFSIGTAYAVKVETKNLVSTKLAGLKVNIRYDRQTGDLQNIRVIATALVYDDEGKIAGTASKSADFSQLPPAQKTNLRNFLLFVGRQINNEAVNEDVDPTLPE